jgi:parallel beta-helix repeat protein
MRKRIWTFLSLFVVCGLCLITFNLSSNRVLVKAQPSEVWVGLSPSNYTTIQEAINAVDNGSIIHVKSGIYLENVRLNKSITLVGENAQTTIIDGNYKGDVLDVVNIITGADIGNFTIRNAGPLPTPGWSGISVSSSSNVKIHDCVVRNCTNGLEMKGSSQIEAGYNTITNNSYGILISSSGACFFYANNVSYNYLDIRIASSTGLHTFYRNNIMQNTNQGPIVTGPTSWDNGAEGNYWSDYLGVDTDGDGIGDTLPQWSDNHPLIEPWSLNRAFSYGVTTFSNTTIASFDFNATLKRISFNSTAPNATIGFCNVTIPNTLMWGDFNVSAGNQSLVANKTEDGNYTYLAFYYNLSSTKTIIITSTYAVPEFQLIQMIVILFLTSLCVLVFKRWKKLKLLSRFG